MTEAEIYTPTKIIITGVIDIFVGIAIGYMLWG